MPVVLADQPTSLRLLAEVNELERYARGEGALAIARLQAFMHSIMESAKRAKLEGASPADVVYYVCGYRWTTAYMQFAKENIPAYIDVVNGLDAAKYEFVGVKDNDQSPIRLAIARTGTVRPNASGEVKGWPFVALIVLGGIMVVSGAIWVVSDAWQKFRGDGAQADLIRAGVAAHIANRLTEMEPKDAQQIAEALAKATAAANTATADNWFVRSVKDVAKVATDSVSSVSGSVGPWIAWVALAGAVAAYFDNRGRRN